MTNPVGSRRTRRLPRLLLAVLSAAVVACLAVPAYADDTGPLTPPGVSGPGGGAGDQPQFNPPSGPVVTLTPDPTMLPPEEPVPGAPATPAPGSTAAPATPGTPTGSSTASATPTPAATVTAVVPPADAMVGPGAVVPPTPPQPVWDVRDALPWWLLWASTALALGGLGVVAVRQRSASGRSVSSLTD